MKIGISSSCLYPMTVEDSLRTVGRLGAETCEIFFNSYSELKRPIITELREIKDYYGLEVRSVHPFTSAYETIQFFSNYRRRTLDGAELYKYYFEAANIMGAEMVVLHGGHTHARLTPEEYAENYIILNNAAIENGVYIAHENVRDHLCRKPEFMKAVSDLVGDSFRMVLDIKQCRRSGESEYDFIDLLGDRICQVHISDCKGDQDCLAPGVGEYDFKKLFSALQAVGYDKTAIIELYRHNYGDPSELGTARQYLNNIIKE